MKIALLNLPIDNNYGGNLQRYALMTVLQRMGHDVTHIFLKVHYSLPWYKYPYSYTKRVLKKFLFCNPRYIREEYYKNIEYERSLSSILPFYNKYINHTKECYNIEDIIKVCGEKYNAFVVGSDQVWRKDMTGQIGLKNFFFSFLSNKRVKRYAYSVSLGTDSFDLNRWEIKKISSLYSLFDMVSVREKSAINVLKAYSFVSPEPQFCLDPTLLLDNVEYIRIIKENDVADVTLNSIFVYILDEDLSKDEIVRHYQGMSKKKIVKIGLTNNNNISIPQWLNNIRLADLVITDSYHGVVFSLIFHRRFVFVGNNRRGNERMASLFDMLHINSSEELDFVRIDSILKEKKRCSMDFLRNIS